MALDNNAQLKEMFARMSSGEVAAHSELGTRDEAKQSRQMATRIMKLKTVTGINARALVMKDVVIPFNPFTGKPDDVYNRTTPYRPILLVSQVIDGIKLFCEDHPDIKEFWQNELGITFTEGETTMEEYRAFKKAGYIKPRIMSYPTVAMNFNGIHGFPNFRVKYTVDPTELNETGSYDFDKAPVWHKAAVFFNSMLRAEANEVVKNLEANGANKDTIQTQRRGVYTKAPVGFVQPTNLIPFFFYPLGEFPKVPNTQNPKDMERNLRYYSYTDKWTIPLKEAMSNDVFDEDIDFFDLTIKTPSSTDTKRDGTVYTDEDANAIYAAMAISNTDGRLTLHGGVTSDGTRTARNSEVFAPVLEGAKAYFLYSQQQSATPGGETFEKIMASSSRFRPIQSALTEFLPACNDIFNSTFAGTKYFNEDIKRAHSEFYIMMNKDNAVALADADEDELDEAKEEAKKSLDSLISEATGRTGVVSEDAALLGIDTTEGDSDSLAELDFAN